MSKFTTSEKIENVLRTIAATEKTIAEKQAELDEIVAANRANVAELRTLRFQEAEEARQAALVNSPKARWDRAVKAVRADGVHFRTNIMKCCRGCIVDADLNLKDAEQAYGYTYGGQGAWIKFNEDGLPFTAAPSHMRRSYDYSTPDRAYINWGNGSAEKIAAAFRAEGFEVEWDGSEFKCVEVIFPKAA